MTLRPLDMCRTCAHAERMPTMIQIRNVPDDVHRTLKVRAAKAGMSLSEYLRDEVGRLAALPTWEEMIDRLKRRQPVTLKKGSAARIIREMRGR